MTRRRRYQLLCPIARALDAIGDRWSLLILRDLHAGPARFQELQDGLGIASNLLSTRLAELSEAGVIHRPEGNRHGPYELTDLGRHTDLVLWELARFGGRLDRDPEPREPGNLRTVVLPLRVVLSAARNRPELTVRLLIDDEIITIESSPDALDVAYGPKAASADLVVRTDYESFLDAGEGRMSLDEFAANHLQTIEGSEHAPAFLALLGAALAAPA